jgi:hypothetical protein
MFTDWNGNGIVDAGTPDNDQVLRYQKQWTSTDVVAPSDNTILYVAFNRNGLALNMPTDGSDFVMTLTTNPANSRWQRCLDITTTGGMQTERQGDVSGHCP